MFCALAVANSRQLQRFGAFEKVLLPSGLVSRVGWPRHVLRARSIPV
jgi:hypothetical protein